MNKRSHQICNFKFDKNAKDNNTDTDPRLRGCKIKFKDKEFPLRSSGSHRALYLFSSYNSILHLLSGEKRGCLVLAVLID